jgi:heme/copper-type cytochrome/quinol oxidase subunit 3
LKTHVVQDLSALPEYEFEKASAMWWGTLGFIAIEGMGFALGIGTYLYLAAVGTDWPLAPPPDPLPGTILLVVLLVSLWPNHQAAANGRRQDLNAVRRDLVIASAIGLVTIVIRGFEFGALNVRWDTNAYGSIVWALVGMHALHLITDVGDTIVLAVLMFTRHGKGRRFTDLVDNAFYWYFIVGSWVVIYVLIYWFPRWIAK